MSAALSAAPSIARRATVAGTKAAQKVLISAVRKNLSGPPRWGHRGSSRIYPTSVNIGTQRGGGIGGMPGRFTGAMRKGVGGKRVPIVVGPAVVGGVGIGGRVNNLKKGPLERKFPYFAPAVESSRDAVRLAYVAAWGAALAKIGA